MIRDASAADEDAIRDVQRTAFARHPLSAHTEHLILDQLRARGRLSVSLVSCDADGTLVGHVAFSPFLIDGIDCRWFGLGPLAVRPEHAQGHGSALARRGLERLRAVGAAGCEAAFCGGIDGGTKAEAQKNSIHGNESGVA